MSNFSALTITVLPFTFSATELEAMVEQIKDNSIEFHELMLGKLPEVVDYETYYKSRTKRVPVGATVRLDDLVSGSTREFHSLRFPLFVPHFSGDESPELEHRYLMLFTDCMDGFVTRGSDTQRLYDTQPFAKSVDTKYGRVYALDLADSSSGLLVYGDMTLLFETVDVMSDFNLEARLGKDVVPPVEFERYRAVQGLGRNRAVRETQEQAEQAARDEGASDPSEDESRYNAKLHLQCNLAPKQDPTPADDIPAFYVDEEPVPSVSSDAEAQPVPPPLPRVFDEPVEVDGADLDRVAEQPGDSD